MPVSLYAGCSWCGSATLGAEGLALAAAEKQSPGQDPLPLRYWARSYQIDCVSVGDALEGELRRELFDDCEEMENCNENAN